MNQQLNSNLDNNFFLEKSIKIIKPCVERFATSTQNKDCIRQIYLGQLEADFKKLQVIT